jgi:hypothetical protein
MAAPNHVLDRDQLDAEATTAQTSLSTTIGALITMNRVADARALLAAVPDDLRTSPELQAWTRVLAEPTFRTSPASGNDFDATLEWLRQHAAEYAGRWVAVRSGKLLGSTESFRELIEIVDGAGGRKGVLVHKL